MPLCWMDCTVPPTVRGKTRATATVTMAKRATDGAGDYHVANSCRKPVQNERHIMYFRLPSVGSAPEKTDGKVGRLKVSDRLNHRLLAVVTGKVGTRHNFL